MDDALATCDSALTLANKIGAPTLIAETEVIQGYVVMLQSIFSISSVLVEADLKSDQTRQALQQAMTQLAEAGLQVTRAL